MRFFRRRDDEVLDRLWAEICPDCGENRRFTKDGKDFLAPPHKGRCVR